MIPADSSSPTEAARTCGLRRAGDILACLPMVRSVVYRMAMPRRLLDDALGAGAYGLVRAAHAWRPGLASFGQYARIRIRGEVREMLGHEHRPMATLDGFDVASTCPGPYAIAAAKDDLHHARARLCTTLPPRECAIMDRRFHGRTRGEIAAAFGISDTRVAQLEKRARATLERRRKRWGGGAEDGSLMPC